MGIPVVTDLPTVEDAHALYEQGQAYAADALSDRVSYEQERRAAARATMLFAQANAAAQLALYRPVMNLRRPSTT